jgi:ribokinase
LSEHAARATGEFRVLVAGDANVDLILHGDVVPRFGQEEQLLAASELVLGSSAGIAACGLARLGVPTSLVAHIGDDEFGRFTSAALTERGVSTEELRVDAGGQTGISVILSTASDRAILTLLGTIPALNGDDVLAAAAGASHVHFASYFLVPRLAAELPGVLARLRADGITTSIDTNWDPSGEWKGLDEVLPLVDYFLPNAAELRAIAAVIDPTTVGTGIDDLERARRLARLGPRVVVKAGKDGGWSVGPDAEHTQASGLPVAVVDTTGAGDSFDAGYLAAVVSGVVDEAERLRWAAAAGSLSTLASGGTAAQASLDDVLGAIRA